MIFLCQASTSNVGIDLGSGKGGVAEELLNGAQISPSIQQMSGKGMPQFVRRNIKGNRRSLDVFVQEHFHGTSTHPFAQARNEERRITL
jgi:hypothetical protein